MGIILIILLLLVLLGVLWGPTVFTLRKNNVPVNTSKIKALLATQVLIVIILVAIEEAIGLLNPGGLIIATTVIVSIAGYLYAKRIAANGS